MTFQILRSPPAPVCQNFIQFIEMILNVVRETMTNLIVISPGGRNLEILLQYPQGRGICWCCFLIYVLSRCFLEKWSKGLLRPFVSLMCSVDFSSLVTCLHVEGIFNRMFWMDISRPSDNFQRRCFFSSV